MMPRSIRWRVTLLGAVVLFVVLGGGAAVTVKSLQSALTNDTMTQNNEILDELVDLIEQGADAASIALPTGADGTDIVILDAEGFLLNINDAASAYGRSGNGIVGSSEWMGDDESEGRYLEYPWYDLMDEEVLSLSDEQLIEIAETSFTTISGAEIVELSDNDVLFVFDREFDLLLDTSFFEEMDEELEAAILDYFEDPDWFETTRSIQTPQYGEITLVAISPIGIISRGIDQLTYTLAIVVPVLTVLGTFALWAAIGVALKPVREISKQAARIAPSNSTERLPVPESGDEVAALTTTLNQMLDRLDDGLERQRQFVSDASHELRSPLTAVKGGAGLLIPDPEHNPPTKAMTALLNGIERLEVVLDDLTQLALGDADEPMSKVDVGDLVHGQVAALSVPEHLRVDASQVEHFAALAFPVPFSRAVGNLLENALRHASSTVVVRAQLVDGATVVVVEDDGSGVPGEDRTRVFERFVRLDEGRSRDRGGSGLGLAIVATIAEVHRGSVECDESPDLGGARFTLRLSNGDEKQASPLRRSR